MNYNMKLITLLPLFFLFQIGNAQSSSAEKFPVTSGYYTSFDGTKIYYEVRGIGKPVLLVHGFIVNMNSWKGAVLYQDLLNDGYQVILLDLRGNGKSDRPHTDIAYANDAEAKDIVGLMKHLRIKRYSVVGYSRGSIITSRLLLLDKRIDKAVLGGIDTQFTDPEWPRRLMFYHALRGDSVPELKGLIQYIHQQKLDQTALSLMQKEQPSISQKELRTIKIPVLVIRGDSDNYNLSAPDLAKMLPKGSYAITPGDHDHAASTPEFSKVVRSFLKKEKQ